MQTGLLSKIEGKVLFPNDDEYEGYRTVWNRVADGQPAMIVVPTGERDVSLAVQHAVQIGKPLCIRGGGHHFAGFAVQKDAVMVHMGQLNGVEVDPLNQVVRVGAGATIGDVDRVTQDYGLALPTGTSSGTGIAGLTLGGGLGHLRRQYGLTCDQLVRARMVLASGDVIEVSEHQHSDILWGLRGGGGNFGIVTEFEFKLYPVGPEVAVVDVFYPATEIRSIMERLRYLPNTAPDQLSFHLLISPLPANPSYPKSLHGQWVVRILGMANEDVDKGLNMIKPLRDLAEPILDFSGVTSYSGLQTRLDANFPDGMYYDGTSVFLETLSPDVIATIERVLEDAEPVSLQLWMLGGQLARYSNTQTAFPVRDAEWVIFINAAASNREKLETRARWMRRTVEAIGRHTSEMHMYLNAIGRQEIAQTTILNRVFGANLERLAQLKKSLDPNNIFRHNVNIWS